MRGKGRRLIAIVLLLVACGFVGVGTVTAIPPTPQRYYHIEPGPSCSECEPVIRTTCQLTGCLDTIDGGGAMCQYNCFPN